MTIKELIQWANTQPMDAIVETKIVEPQFAIFARVKTEEEALAPAEETPVEPTSPQENIPPTEPAV